MNRIKNFGYIVLKIITFINLGIMSNIVYSQELTIKSFTELLTDATASTYQRNDNNGKACALIKVRIASENVTFKGMVMGDVKYDRGEYYVYMPEMAKKLIVSAPNYLPIDVDFASFGINSLVGKTTYLLTISNTSIQTSSPASERKFQYIVFNITPKDALLEFDGEELALTDGTAMKYVPFGQYKYNVGLSEYHSERGSVEVSDPSNKKIVNIVLKPAFGWINIPENKEIHGAKVYIDNKSVGYIPINNHKLSSGQHVVKVIRDMYKPYETKVTIEDSKTKTITPTFTQNFSNVTISVADNAEIWINGENKGTTKWSGKLSFGNYLFETKKAGHRNGELTKDISSTDYNVNLTLPKPTPIYGSLKIEVEPALSKIKIDGKYVGESPMIVDKILIGAHQIEISKNDFWPIDSLIIINENQQSSIKEKLIKGTDKYLVKKEFGKYGMVDQNGKKVVDFQYDSISNFTNGLATALLKNKYGLLGINGKEIVPCRYEELTLSKNDMYLCKFNGKFGYLDILGQNIIPPIYNELYSFENGVAKVKKGNLFGYIDINNKEVIKIIYDSISKFNDNLAIAKFEGRYGFINRIGEIAIPFDYGDVEPFSEGYAKVEKYAKYGFINKNGEIVIPLKYDDAPSFKNYYFPIKKNKKWGFESLINKRIKTKFYDVGDFSCGLAPAKTKKLWGYINTKGKWVIKPQFNVARSFNEDVAVVCKNGFYGFIDNKGKVIVPFEYNDVGLFENGTAIITKYKKGIIDCKGNIIAPCEYDYIKNFGEDNFAYGYNSDNHNYYRITRDGEITLGDANCGLFVYEAASFPGGTEKFMQWLSKNLKYPASAQDNGTQGRVVVQFVIDKNGLPNEVKIIKSVDPALDKEAIRIVKSMPKWNSAFLCGEAIKSDKITLPVTFRLQ